MSVHRRLKPDRQQKAVHEEENCSYEYFSDEMFCGPAGIQVRELFSLHRALWNLYIVHSPTKVLLLNL